MTMHMCEASITTPTPAGSVTNSKNFGVEGCNTWMELLLYVPMASKTAEAISLVNRS